MYRRGTLALVLTLGCAAPPTTQFEIRTRDPRALLVPEAQQRAYREEFDSVRSRRLQLDDARPDVEDVRGSRSRAGIVGGPARLRSNELDAWKRMPVRLRAR